MTYHTHGRVAGIDITAALAAFFVIAATNFAYAALALGPSVRGVVAAHGLALALSMYWGVYAEVHDG